MKEAVNLTKYGLITGINNEIVGVGTNLIEYLKAEISYYIDNQDELNDDIETQIDVISRLTQIIKQIYFSNYPRNLWAFDAENLEDNNYEYTAIYTLVKNDNRVTEIY